MSVSKVAARVKPFFIYHHTSSLLCGKILTTPTFLLLKYGFIADARLEAKNAKGGNLNRNCFQQYHVFPKLGKPR